MSKNCEEGMMSFINEQVAAIFMGAFIALASRQCKISIPLWQEILGMMIGLGVVWLLQKYCGWFSHVTFMEQVRFVLIGYLPMRAVRWGKKDKKE